MKRLTWINLVLGIWLIFAPYTIGGATALTGASMANDAIIGILLIASSLWILASPTAPAAAAWFQVLCGVWLIIAPYAIGHGGMTPLGRNDVIAGVIAAIVGVVESRGIARMPRAAA